MEPLSVAASIVGILAAAGKVAEVLGPVVSSLNDTSKIATAIYAEVSSARIILSALQTLLDDLEQSSFRRRGLIQVDQLVATLTDGALIFNELEPQVSQLGTSTEKWRTKIQWTRKKDVLDSFVSRLQLFKGSINVMLSILQCESDMDASRKQHELHLLTQNLLDSNHNLAHRLSLLEDSQVDSALRISWNPGKVDQRSSRLSIASQIRTFGFERDLEGTWVYRKARRSTSDVSFRSSVALSHAWSTLSDVSLSHISAISVIALPLSRSELTNGHYYRLKAPHSSVPQQTSRWKELPPPPPQTNDSIVRPICEPSELHFFVSDFLDSMASTDTDGRSSYARTSIAPSLARGSVASTIYRLDAMVSPLPAQTIVRQRVPIVTIVSNGSNNSVDTSHDTAPDPQSESGEPREVRIGLRRPRGDFPSRISIPPITENDSFVQDNGAEVESVTQSVLDELEGNTEESSLIMSNTQNTPTTYLGKFFATYQICVLGGAGTEKHELEQQIGALGSFEVLAELPGQELYTATRYNNHVLSAEGFVVVYSVTSRASFEEVGSFVQLVLRLKDKDYFPMVLVGNHCDTDDSSREVYRGEGEVFAKLYGCPFQEVHIDSSHSVNIAEATRALVEDITQFRQPRWRQGELEVESENIPPFGKLGARWRKRSRAATVQRRGSMLEPIDETKASTSPKPASQTLSKEKYKHYRPLDF